MKLDWSLLFGAALLVAACSGDDEATPDGNAGSGGGGGSSGGSGGGGGSGAGSGACAVTPPADWSAPDFSDNAAEPLALRQQLMTLTGEATMRGMETGDVAIGDGSLLDAAMSAGDPSLDDVVSPGFEGFVTDSFEEFEALVAAGTVDLVDDGGNWTPGDAGGLYGSSPRGINEGGLEVRQIVDKGLFTGGALYAYALSLTEGSIEPATIDALAAAFGTNPDLNPGRSDAADEADQNVHSANYAFAMGYYGDAKQALIDAKAYAADAACEAERDAALVTFFSVWEQSMMARFIYYANEGAAGVVNAAGDDDIAGALHEAAEGFGLAMGFYGLPSPSAGPLADGGRIVTDAELETALGALGIDVKGDLGAATVGTWVEDPLGFSTAVSEAEDAVGQAYGWDDAALEAAREPNEG